MIEHDTSLLDSTPGVRIDLTSELRWFFRGPLPDDVVAWFTVDGAAGLPEQRVDLYRTSDEVDAGLKRRGGTILELKLRHGSPAAFELDDRSVGLLERWQRWSPADDRVLDAGHVDWTVVDKSIVKRRFDLEGTEFMLTEATRPMTGVGCDAEIVAVSVDGASAWSFSFAAFGPLDDHQRLLTEAWSSLLRRPRPAELVLGVEHSFGYPQWLAGGAAGGA